MNFPSLKRGGGGSFYRRKVHKLPPLSIKPPFSEEPPSLLSPLPPSLHPYSSQTINLGLISYGLFRLEIHIVLGLQPYDTQLHELNVFNFKPASTQVCRVIILKQMADHRIRRAALIKILTI